MKILTKIPKTYLFLGIIILLIVVISLFELNSPKNANSPSFPVSKKDEKTIKLEKEEGDVDVVVEYLPEKSDNDNIVFNIALDTHNVNLDPFDFSKDVMLEKEGIVSIPIKSSPTGNLHHRKAEVILKRVNPPFSVVLKNLSSIPKREFQFINL